MRSTARVSGRSGAASKYRGVWLRYWAFGFVLPSPNSRIASSVTFCRELRFACCIFIRDQCGVLCRAKEGLGLGCLHCSSAFWFLEVPVLAPFLALCSAEQVIFSQQAGELDCLHLCGCTTWGLLPVVGLTAGLQSVCCLWEARVCPYNQLAKMGFFWVSA